MADKEFVEALLERLRAGDEGAAAEIFDRFVKRLVVCAQAQLHDSLRQKVDPEDVVQSVFRTFFRRYREGRFKIDSWESIWGILTVITLRKCGSRIDYFRAARRDIRREVAMKSGDESTDAWEAVARDPTPVEAAVLAETVEQLLRGLEERDADIVALHLQGYTISEVSNQVGYAKRTVRRTLERIRKRMDRIDTCQSGSN